MLTHEENERLVRVGPDTPAGALFRRYWQPALLSRELEENDGPPVRVRLLGEDLVAFRDSLGRVGLIEAYCPHRRAPLFFGRNEECGLRCVYHGWKFDVEGTCVDMPSEPPDSNFKSKVRLKAYPTVERGGMVWAYLGPPEAKPEAPDYEWLRAPETHRHITKVYERCNYLQALEGGLDSSHSSFLHNNRLGDREHLRNRDRAPKIEVEATGYGYRAASIRRLDEGRRYVRVYHYVLPAQQMRAGTVSRTGEPLAIPKLDGHIWVPIDDEHTWVYNWSCGYDRAAALTPEYMEKFDSKDGRSKVDFIPGTFQLKQNIFNDYLIDRQAQKTATYTGIKGVNTQDYALQEGMGPIVDRSGEHLGSSDKAIIALRRALQQAMDAVERGDRPGGVDPGSHRALRAHDRVIPADADWRRTLGPELVAKW